MGVDLYTLRKKAAIIILPDGRRTAAYFLQLAVRNALSQDAQELVDRVVKAAFREWAASADYPEFVLQVDLGGMPEMGAPIFRWERIKKVYCFDSELVKPFGFLGERKLNGFLFRTVEEQRILDDLSTARKIDMGHTKAYRDFWEGLTFRSGEEFLAYRRRPLSSSGGHGGSRVPSGNVRAKLSKILSLIRHIEFKGPAASPADQQFLENLKEKASQLGYTF